MLTPVGFNRYRLANTEFISTAAAEVSTGSCFYVNAPRQLLETYHIIMGEELRFGRILRVTGQDGGSSALTCLVAAPSKLVSVSTSDTPPTALEAFAKLRGVERSLRAYHGIAQEDRGVLAGIAESEFGSDGLEAVIDDVANQLDATRTSFEALFPYLRPGGRYIIEGWAFGHQLIRAWFETAGLTEAERNAAVEAARAEQGKPIEAILSELLLVSRARPQLISRLTVSEFWIEVRRGDDEVDPATFRVGSAVA